MMAALEARGRALCERRADAVRGDVVARVAAMPGLRAGIAGETVVIEGRALVRRWIEDAGLRTSIGGL